MQLSSVDFRLGGCGHPFEKIEVAALIRLRDMALVQRTEATREFPRRSFPRCTPARELGIAHLELELARGDVELDQIAVGRKIAAQYCEAAVFHERFVARQDHIAIEDFRARDVLAERASIDRAFAER